MDSADDYSGRCKAFVIAHSEALTSEDVGWAMHLIDHGEPAEGLCALAWALDRARRELTVADAAVLIDLLGGLVPAGALPPWITVT